MPNPVDQSRYEREEGGERQSETEEIEGTKRRASDAFGSTPTTADPKEPLSYLVAVVREWHVKAEPAREVDDARHQHVVPDVNDRARPRRRIVVAVAVIVFAAVVVVAVVVVAVVVAVIVVPLVVVGAGVAVVPGAFHAVRAVGDGVARRGAQA